MDPKLTVNSHPPASLILSGTVTTRMYHHAQHGQYPYLSGHVSEEQYGGTRLGFQYLGTRGRRINASLSYIEFEAFLSYRSSQGEHTGAGEMA